MSEREKRCSDVKENKKTTENNMHISYKNNERKEQATHFNRIFVPKII